MRKWFLCTHHLTEIQWENVYCPHIIHPACCADGYQLVHSALAHYIQLSFASTFFRQKFQLHFKSCNYASLSILINGAVAVGPGFLPPSAPWCVAYELEKVKAKPGNPPTSHQIRQKKQHEQYCQTISKSFKEIWKQWYLLPPKLILPYSLLWEIMSHIFFGAIHWFLFSVLELCCT